MSDQLIADATVIRANGLPTGSWGDDSVLTLVFQLEDGRRAHPTFIPGHWQIADFLRMVDVSSVAQLVGIRVRVVLLDPEAPIPTVTEVLASTIPAAFRRAFEGDQ